MLDFWLSRQPYSRLVEEGDLGPDFQTVKELPNPVSGAEWLGYICISFAIATT